MTQFTPPPAPSEVEAFIGQVVTDLSAAFSGVLVNVGRKLGLYQAMADLGACTSVALAALGQAPASKSASTAAVAVPS